ncbi:MAG: hypothetical protein H6Q91_253 [Deltaproteobacteria bacterium]|nr:hypothetical protein [Deltaproteobacteria bacterium]
MATCRFEREIAIAAPRDRVFAELSEPARFLGLQPLLTEVREVPAAAGVRAFEAVERVPLLGRIAVRNHLRVELTPLPEQDRIAFTTRAPLGIELVGAFGIHAEEAATRVRESVRIHCPLVLRRFVEREAIRAQQALLANLKRRLEAPLG